MTLLKTQISRYLSIYLILLSVFLIAPKILAEHLPVKIYTSADGLGSSFVDYLMRDSRGFMWFCTRDGLSRFDGVRFVTYQVGDKNSPPGIESIFETRSGIYWVTTTGGTYRFNPNDISQFDPVLPRLNAQFITPRRGQFFEDSRGNLWFSSNGLYRLKEIDGESVFEPYNLALPSNLDSESILFGDSAEADDGSIWMNTNIGVIRLLPDERIVYYPFETALNSGNTAMMADKKGYIWLTRNNHLLVMMPESVESFTNAGKVIIRSISPNISFELKPEEKYIMPEKEGDIIQFSSQKTDAFIERSYSKKIFQTSDGNVWITAENYLMQFADGIIHIHTDKEGLPNVMARMAEDAAGNLWIGSYTGLARIDRNGLITFGKADGANSSRFFAIIEANDGTLYFAAHDFYLNRFDGEKMQPIRPQIPSASNFLWTSRYSFLDSNKNWWFLTGDKLYRFDNISDFEELKTKSPTVIYSSDDGLQSNGIFQIFENSNGDIWVSTRDDKEGSGTGTARLKKGEEKFHTFGEAEGLPKAKSFSSAVLDWQGNIWFSFYNGGLARFNGERFEYWGEESGFPNAVLPDLFLDKKGRLWIASAIGGLFRVDDTSAKTPSFVHLTTADGLSSNNIRTITGDNLGRIYLGSVRGIDRISPDTGNIKHYSVSDGLAADFVVDSHCDKNGNLWFATNNGVSRLIPPPDEEVSAPRILLGGIKIAGEQQAISQLGSAEIEKGELSANQNNLQFDFFGLDFRAGQTLRYQYKLEGSNTDWSIPSELRTVTYANLQPGTYRFTVRAINSEGVISQNPAVVSFKILPPIWLRWWFITLGVLLIAGIILAFYGYRMARLQEINVALADAKKAEERLSNSRAERIAELERVRTRIATDLHDDIGASLTQIAILSEVAQAQNRGNGSTESLTKISTVSNELVGTMSDIVWSINPSKDHLSDLTQRMRRFASDSLSAKGITFQFNSSEIDQEIVVKSNLRREVFLIFKESINNIVKHSEANHVEIKLQISDENLGLKITDNGKGFNGEKAYENSLSSISMGRNGILSMQKRAEEMNGELEVSSKIGKGTTVELKLPMEFAQTQIPNL